MTTAFAAPAPLRSPLILMSAAEFAARYESVHAELVKGVVKVYPRPTQSGTPERLFTTPPHLVVEVRSPSNRWSDIYVKIGEYLGAGVRIVVLIDPPSASASVYRVDELPQVFHNGDEPVLPDVLPGFAVPVSRLFA